MSPLLIGVVLICFFLALYVWFDIGTTKHVREMVQEFEKAFPGGCVICSYHAFGIREGLIHFSLPKDHRCPERWERWRGMLHKGTLRK